MYLYVEYFKRYVKGFMASFINVSKFSPTSPGELKKQKWHRLDCLTKYKLANDQDTEKLRDWFKQQDEAWRLSRQELFNERLLSRGNNVYLRY
jgi:hypothetical protein